MFSSFFSTLSNLLFPQPKEQGSPYVTYDSIKLIAFDFDCTISKIPSPFIPLLDSFDVKKIIADPSVFESICERLFGDGKILAITSFGNDAIIRRTLHEVFRGPVFYDDDILTPVSMRWGVLPPYWVLGKNEMLDKLAAKYSLHPSEILLLDDNPNNVRHAREAGYRSRLIPPISCRGINRELLQNYHPDMPKDEFERMWEAFMNS